MSRARHKYQTRHTAAANETIRASGCLSSYLLPPFAVLFVGALLAIFAFNSSGQAVSARASSSTNTVISQIFTPEIQYWNSSISRWASASNLDPNLVAVVMQIESCGNPSARSGAGAMGLFQVMPYHFEAADDPYDPDTNAARGLGYLKRSLTTSNNNVRLALAGYNGGISVISIGEWFWAAETSRYVYWGSGIYEDTLTSAAQSARLKEWLNAGGTSLCNQAKQKLGIND
jgi:soluble lytic murein transglycosylase-like protein